MRCSYCESAVASQVKRIAISSGTIETMSLTFDHQCCVKLTLVEDPGMGPRWQRWHHLRSVRPRAGWDRSDNERVWYAETMWASYQHPPRAGVCAIICSLYI